MKYLWMVAPLILAGCTSRYDAQVAHVAAGQPMHADALRLLPTDYYLVDGEQRTPVRQLTVRGER